MYVTIKAHFSGEKKPYTFLAPKSLELNSGNLVVAKTANGLGIVRVLEVEDPPKEYPFALKWAFQKVDLGLLADCHAIEVKPSESDEFEAVPSTPKEIQSAPKEIPSTPKVLPSEPKPLPSAPKAAPSTPKVPPSAPKVPPENMAGALLQASLKGGEGKKKGIIDFDDDIPF